MFSITDNERLRDAYALLMFMQRDISASAEKKAAVKNLAAVPPLRREDAGQTDPRSTEPPRQGRVHLRGLRHR